MYVFCVTPTFSKIFLLQLPGYPDAKRGVRQVMEKYLRPVTDKGTKNQHAVDMVLFFSDDSRPGFLVHDYRHLYECGFFSDVEEVTLMPSLVMVRNSIKGLENLNPPLLDPMREETKTQEYALHLLARSFDLSLLATSLVRHPDNEKLNDLTADIQPDLILKGLSHKGAIGKEMTQRLRAMCLYTVGHQNYDTMDRFCQFAEESRLEKYHFYLRKLCRVIIGKCVVGKIMSLLVLEDLRKCWDKWEKKAKDLLKEQTRWCSGIDEKSLKDAIFTKISELEEGLPQDEILEASDFEEKEDLQIEFCYRVLHDFLEDNYRKAEEVFISCECHLIEVQHIKTLIGTYFAFCNRTG